jgi:NADH-quinone oxidoreductase subunit L
VSALWAAFAIFVAFKIYGRATGIPARVAAALGPLYRGSLNKWYVDEIYEALIIGPIKKLTQVLDFLDRWLVDGRSTSPGT